MVFIHRNSSAISLHGMQLDLIHQHTIAATDYRSKPLGCKLIFNKNYKRSLYLPRNCS